MVPIIAGRRHGPAPDDHLIPRPHCRVRISRGGRVSESGRCPIIRARVVSATRVRVVERFIDATPDYHFIAVPYCCVSDPAKRHIYEAGREPTVVSGIISTASVQVGVVRDRISPTPDYHFIARPHCGVIPACGWRVRRRDSRPTVGARIVSSAAV